MKKSILGVATVTLFTVGMVSVSQAQGWSVSPSFSSSSSNELRSGRDSASFGKNSGGRDKIDNKQRYDNSSRIGKNGAGRDKIDNKQRYDNSTKFGNNATVDSNNRYSSSDSRQWNTTDSRNMSDNRNLSDNRITTTTDSRDLSDRRDMSDNRDQSDRSYKDYSDHSNRSVTNNQQYNQRYGSHEAGGALFEKEVNIRTGHENVTFGAVSGGQGNVMDASVNGNTVMLGNSSK